MTNKHPHAKMIKAKVDNMSLVVFSKKHDNSWAEIQCDDCVFIPDFEYFICLPRHKDAVLNSLNGGTSETYRAYTGGWAEACANGSDGWNYDFWYMDESRQSRIKPRKQKRWIGVNGNGLTTRHYATKDELIASLLRPIDWSCVEVELEV